MDESGDESGDERGDGRVARREALFQEALDLSSAERPKFLATRCADDSGLIREVEELLELYAAAGTDFLERPVFEDVSDETEVPSSVGDYRIVRLLGAGGMGLVYEAEQERPRRRVAIKVLRPGLYGEAQIRRFRLECDVLGQLSHPGIAQVYEAGTARVVYPRGPAATLAFLAMELVEGRNVLEYVRAQGLERTARLELFARICDAVDHAHQQAVIHRDLKPANILVDGNGNPKILDFGVARVTSGEDGLSCLTRTGDIIGTVRYMSPEQLRGEPRVDVRSDVYSLGVVLFELLSGASPHGPASSSISEMLARIARGDPPRLSAHDRGLRGDLDAIASMALASSPDERYASAAALADDVRRHLDGSPVRARGQRLGEALRRLVSRHRTAFAFAGTVAMLVVASAVLAWSLYTRERRAQRESKVRLWESYVARASLEQQAGKRGRRLDSLEILRSAAEIRPSVEVRDGVIAALALSDFERVASGPFEGEASVRGLHTTDRLAMVNGAGLTRVLSVPGFEELARLQGPAHLGYVLDFSPDGRYLAAKYHPRRYSQREVKVWVWDVAAGRTVLRLEDGEAPNTPRFVFGESTPVGPWVAMAHADGLIRQYRLDTGEVWRVLEPPMHGLVDLTISPDGHRLAAVTREGELSVLDAESGDRILSGELEDARPTFVVWAPQGNLFIGDQGGAIHQWDPVAGEPRPPLVGHQAHVSRFDVATDGSFLASSAWDATMRLWDPVNGKPMLAPFVGEVLKGAGSLLVSASTDSLHVYRHVPSLSCKRLEPGAYRPGDTAVWAPRGRLVLTTDPDVGVQLRDIDSGATLFTVRDGWWKFATIVDDPEPRLVAFKVDALLSWPLGLRDGEARLGEPKLLWSGRGTSYGGACLDATRRKALVTHPSRIVLLDLETGEALVTLPGSTGVGEPALHPRGRWAFTGVWKKGNAKLWDLEAEAMVAEIPTGEHALGDFSPDGELLVVCDGPTLAAYEVGTWNERYRIHPKGRRAVADRPVFAPDGRTMILGCHYDVRLYEVATGERIATFTPPDQPLIEGCCFSADGNSLVAVTTSGIYVWDLVHIRAQLAERGLDWE